MKKIKKKKLKDVAELLHHFANRVNTTGEISNYRYEIEDDIGKLYRFSNLLAIVNYKKKYILHNRFSFSGWGVSYGYWDLSRAFKSKFVSIGTDYSLDSDNFVEHLSSHIFHDFYARDLEQYIIFKELQHGESARAIPYFWNTDERNKLLKIIHNFSRRLGLKKSDIYNLKFKYDKGVVYHPHGWNKRWIRYSNTICLNDIVKDKILTKDEKKRLEYIKWRCEIKPYITRDVIPISRKYTWVDIYNNPEFKQYIDENLPKFKARQLELDRIESERRVREYERRNKEEREKKLDRYNKWLEGWLKDTIGSYTYFSGSYLFPAELKLVHYPSLESEVYTTRGARVPIEDAKSLYKLFKSVIEKGTELRLARKVGVYTLTYIGKDDTGYYLTVGCHRIYEEQVDKFIKRFKLDW